MSQTEHFEPNPLQISDGFVEKLESITSRKAEVAQDEAEKARNTPEPTRREVADEGVGEAPPSPMIEQDRDQVEETEIPKISTPITPEFIAKLEHITAGQAEAVESSLEETPANDNLLSPNASRHTPPPPPPPTSHSPSAASSNGSGLTSQMFQDLTKQNKQLQDKLTQLFEQMSAKDSNSKKDAHTDDDQKSGPKTDSTEASKLQSRNDKLKNDFDKLTKEREQERTRLQELEKELEQTRLNLEKSKCEIEELRRGEHKQTTDNMTDQSISSSSSSCVSAIPFSLKGNPLSFNNLYTVMKPKSYPYFPPSWAFGAFRLVSVVWIFFAVKVTRIVSVNILGVEKEEFASYLQ